MKCAHSQPLTDLLLSDDQPADIDVSYNLKELQTAQQYQRLHSMQELALRFYYSSFAGYTLGLVVSIVVVIKGLASFKRINKAIRQELVKLRVIMYTK
eukprot:scaffold352896_cov55-Prasinocladus_malaysianus.AAC.1